VAGLRAVKAVLGATVQIPDAAFERHSPFNPHQIGEQLAARIDAYVRGVSLGYYPALDYFQETGVVDSSLREVLDQLAWLGTSLVRDELSSRLRAIFASVQVQSMQALVYNLPPVRPNQENAVQHLARHLTPNRARFEVLLTLLRKQMDTEHLESFTRRVVWRHLGEAFDTIEIGHVNLLQQGRY
jgi:hypothetical protein